MSNELEMLNNLLSTEKAIRDSTESIIEHMTDKFVQSLIGKKVQCYDYTSKDWYKSTIENVQLSTSFSGAFDGDCYVRVCRYKGTPKEIIQVHMIIDVKFI